MATLLRATVMLSVLVGLPAAWIYYGPLPERAQEVVDELIERGSEAIGWNRVRAQSQPKDQTGKQQAAADLVDFQREDVLRPAQAQQPVATTPVANRTQEDSPGPADFEPLLRQLRHLGASGYDLETWGEAETLYRFHCTVPLVVPEAGAAAFTQQFEAIADDPQESIALVVAEVAQWYAGRQTR